MRCEFEQVTTLDGIDLQGLIFSPKRSTDTVALWIHGLASSFHNSYKRLTTMARVLNECGVALAAFDTRGHDVVSRNHIEDKRKIKGHRSITIGAAYEQFKKCDLDIHAIVKLLKQRFKNVILIGHSTGANKSIYYVTRTRFNKEVKGVILVSPVSDVPIMRREAHRKFKKALEAAHKMASEEKGWELMPREFVQSIYTSQRFLSLADQNSIEQMFPSKRFKGPLWKFSKIKLPMLVIMGENDKYIDYSVGKHVERFKVETTSRFFASKIVVGADHSFAGKEEELAGVVANWINGLD